MFHYHAWICQIFKVLTLSEYHSSSKFDPTDHGAITYVKLKWKPTHVENPISGRHGWKIAAIRISGPEVILTCLPVIFFKFLLANICKNLGKLSLKRSLYKNTKYGHYKLILNASLSTSRGLLTERTLHIHFMIGDANPSRLRSLAGSLIFPS